jgi:hypothetical protein
VAVKPVFLQRRFHRPICWLAEFPRLVVCVGEELLDGSEFLEQLPFHSDIYLQQIVCVSTDEMEASIRAALDVRRKRDQNVRNLENEKFQMMVQSLQRKTVRLFRCNKTAEWFPEVVDNTNSPTNSLSKFAAVGNPPCDDNDNKNDDLMEYPRSPGRHSLLLRFGSTSRRRSCHDLSTSCHPVHRDIATLRRINSLDTTNKQPCSGSWAGR